jgi:uncharacterized protein YigA (DUF484 family)
MSKEMDKETLIAFLQDNPNFLQDNPDVAELLIPEKKRAVRGQPADFQAYMIERLKADKEEVTETARELIENSRANMNNQTRIHEAVLRLLEAKKFDEFIHILTMDLPTMLDVDIATLVVEADGENIPHVQTTGIRIIPPGTVDTWMNGTTVIQESDVTGIEAIYGGGATLVRSQILLRIDIAMETPPAILAFGSRDPHAFNADQATDQILFLARVIERCFRSWLSLPV